MKAAAYDANRNPKQSDPANDHGDADFRRRHGEHDAQWHQRK